MTLYDYINQHTFPEEKMIEELTVWDQDYDIEIYFYSDCLDPQDTWDKAMAIIAKKLKIIKINSKECVTVNLSEMVKRNISNGKFDSLFIHNNVDSIMADIHSIFAGYVSESWMMEFAKSLV